jgi:hypothetical protein
MQYVLLIYQGTGWDAIGSMSDQQKQKIGEQYSAIISSPGVTPGPPLGLPQDATTVRVPDGAPVLADGPYVDAEGAIGGYILLEADNLDDAIDLAARIPAARLGGGIEIRPIGTYW